MKYFIVIVCLFCLSCSPIIKTMYGVNKNIKFKNTNDYTYYLSKNYHFNIENLYYAQNETSYKELATDIINKHTDFFYGIFLNDTTQIKKSDFLIENESCRSRILKEINSMHKNNTPLNTQNNTLFKKNSFKNIVTDKPINLSANNRKKVVLVFSYKLGTLKENDFKEIEKLLFKNEYDLYIISLDRVHDFKK